MAYANVQNSGELRTVSSASLSWTPGVAPTVANLLTCRGSGYHSGGWTPSNTNVHDSTGTPKNFTADSQFNGTVDFGGVGIWSLIVPAGLTTPLVEAVTQALGTVVFDEWSGNDSSSVLDQVNSNDNHVTPQNAGNSGSINTGASAGIALAVACMDSGDLTTITTTGTSFVQDIVEQASASWQTLSADKRTATIASQTGIQDSWTWNGSAVTWQACIASYKVPAASLPPGLGPAGEMEMATQSAISAMMR